MSRRATAAATARAAATVAVVVAAAALAACVPEPAATTSQQAPVIGGTPTTDGEYPAVGALWLGFGVGCTGTLIRPDVVLTAAHCLDPAFIGDEIPGFTLDGDPNAGVPVVVPGRATARHELFQLDVELQPGPQQFYDVGLVFLAQPITTVEPMTMATPAEAAAALAPGLAIELVGYGITDEQTGAAGIKTSAVADLVTFSDSELQISTPGQPQNCNGDSGGPGIADLGAGPRLVGIVSRSADVQPGCAAGGIDTRVDYYLGWIEDRVDGPCPSGCTDAGAPDAAPDAAGPDAGPAPDASDPGVDGDGAGCCSAGDGSASGAGGALLLAALVLGRMRRRRAAAR